MSERHAIAIDTIVRSFIDLRTFAAQARTGNPSSGSGDPFLAGRRWLPLPQGPVSVAVLDLDGSGKVAALAHDEFFILLSGALVVTSQGNALRFARDDSGVIPGGAGFDWRAEPGTRAIVMRCASGNAGASTPIRIDTHAPLSPSNPPLAELLVGPTPSCRNFTAYRSANGEFTCGTWDSTPYSRKPMDFKHYELMHLLEGSVTLVDGAGREATFSAGDVLLVEQHSRCSWDSRVQVKKVYAVYRPA
jgi:uncharacterized cupin superfamily protein